VRPTSSTPPPTITRRNGTEKAAHSRDRVLLKRMLPNSASATERVQLSVGIERPDDLTADLERALATARCGTARAQRTVRRIAPSPSRKRIRPSRAVEEFAPLTIGGRLCAARAI